MNEKQNNEAAAVAFFSFKRIDGFEVSLTLRDDTGAKVLERIDGAIQAVIKSGGTPIAKYQGKSFSDRPSAPEKPCEFHPGKMLKEKTLPDGKKLWSHSRGIYPNLQYCNGSGFPDERYSDVIPPESY